MVTTAESVANLREAVVRQLLGQRHRQLPRARDRAAALLGQQIPNAEFEVIGDGFLDIFDRDQPLLQSEQIPQGLFRKVEVDRPARKARIRNDAAQRPLELPDI